MKIQDIFAKPIDREITGVIKVGQDDEHNIRQELEEYVVTRELQKHFADFFENYKKGIVGNTDKMGVWISGFFGSGKSHLLKILSYLIENREVDGKPAIEYFLQDGKINDNMVIADIKLAANTPTDVILFNIDSKGETGGKKSESAIVSVFLKVFNEMQGFCGALPHLADLERNLVKENKYEEFKNRFEASYGDKWEAVRNEFDFIQDDVVDVLDEIGFMSVEAARNWCEKTTEAYEISIERFADMVKKYIDGKGSNHHVVFLVDEIGQYIGDDSKLMLNLQTVTEDLGRICQGKAWIIVTSQQDIDSITRTKGNDFSKIQGRFDTRLSLSSANVDEVIKKRILDKNATGAQTLGLLYDEKDTIIRNLIIFNDGIEKKLYADRANFTEVYPFVPYQFNLLGDVLTSIRTHSSSGKHLADGERSMLALFKEAAVRLMGEDDGAIVPFNLFYDTLEQFLDHSYRNVIIRASNNQYINQNNEKYCFNVEVLKVLFMIKYVKEIVPNIENITSLLVSNIDDDRIALKNKVEESLKLLIRQTLVQKNGDQYIFLTDEEQEINREIEKEDVEIAEIRQKVSEMIFDDIYDNKKYVHPHLKGRYNFGFNQILDDQPYKGGQSYDISLKILTPNYDKSMDDSILRMMSGQENSVVVALPNDKAFIDEIRSALKIEKYLRRNSSGTPSRHEEIKAQKQVEMRERKDNARIFLIEALKEATIYTKSDKLEIGAKSDIAARINEAMGKLVQTVYHKLTYITEAMGETQIRSLLKSYNNSQISIDTVDTTPNRLALTDLKDYIETQTSSYAKVSLKSISDRFMKAPYGFISDDIQWLITKLFRDGDVAFTVNSEPVTLLNKEEEEIFRIVNRKEYLEKLLISKKDKSSDKEKKAVREVMKELFNITSTNDDDDSIMKDFNYYAERSKNELEKTELYYSAQPKYPGKAVIESGKALLLNILSIKSSSEFFRTITEQKETFIDFAEDYVQVRDFFAGEQVKIWDNSLKYMDVYHDSKIYIVNQELEVVVADIEKILSNESPYTLIRKLPKLNDDFILAYTGICIEEEKPVQESIKMAREKVMGELADKSYANEFADRVKREFDELKERAEKCQNVATLQSLISAADALKIRILGEIRDYEKELIEQQLAAEAAKADLHIADNIGEGLEPLKPIDIPKPKQKTQKTISIRTVNTEQTWRIESEADIDKYIETLRSKLKAQLQEDTVINVEF